MTRRHTRRTAGPACALGLALTLALGMTGCGASGDDGSGKVASASATGTPGASESPGTGGPGPSDEPSSGASEKVGAPSPSASEPGTPKGGYPTPADVDQKDADEVAEGALTAMWTYDTKVDSGPQDATARTVEAGWLTDSYAKELRGRQPQAAPSAQWEQWKSHRAHTKVELTKTEDASRPGDTATEAWRQWTISTTPQGRDGWKQKPTAVLAYVQLARSGTDAPWRIAGVTVR